MPELLEDSKKADVQILMLSDHFRPPKDFMDGWRGIRDGVLFIPGSEGQGFLLYPDASVISEMDGPKEELVEATTQGSGLIFLSRFPPRIYRDLNCVLKIADPFNCSVVRVKGIEVRVIQTADIDRSIGSYCRRGEDRAIHAVATGIDLECPEQGPVICKGIKAPVGRADIDRAIR